MSKRRRYRALIEERAAHVLPGVYDALSARLAEKAGFQMIGAGGYAAIGSMLGGPDIGQSNMRDLASHYGRICAAVEAPVSVDADTGFGDVHNVTQMIRAFEDGDVSGILLGDQVFPNRCGYLPGKAVVPIEEMLAKIRAAVTARRDPDMVIIARTDSYSDHGLDEAIHRCRLFLEAGADYAKPQGVDKPDEIARCIAEIPCPFLATLSQAARRRATDVAELRRLGVGTVSMPSLSLFAAARAVGDVLDTLFAEHALASVEPRLMSLDDYNALVQLDREMEREETFREEARRVVEMARLSA